MRSLVVVLPLLLLSMSVNAQEERTTVSAGELAMEDYTLQLRSLPRDEVVGTDLSAVELKLPESLDVPQRERVLELWSELQDLCPGCSTGGTIGGETVVGANVLHDSSAPLFRKPDADIVFLTKENYNRLLEEANACKQNPPSSQD